MQTNNKKNNIVVHEFYVASAVWFNREETVVTESNANPETVETHHLVLILKMKASTPAQSIFAKVYPIEVNPAYVDGASLDDAIKNKINFKGYFKDGQLVILDLIPEAVINLDDYYVVSKMNLCNLNNKELRAYEPGELLPVNHVQRIM